MTVNIRRATAADESTVTAFNAALAWESERKQLDARELQAGVRAVLADSSKGFYTLAEEGGVVVGQAMVTFEWSDWRNGWFWWVQSVYVREEFRRGGIFRAIFQQLIREAEAEATVVGLRLYVERENSRAKATYLALGMVETPYHLLELCPLPGRAIHPAAPG